MLHNSLQNSIRYLFTTRISSILFPPTQAKSSVKLEALLLFVPLLYRLVSKVVSTLSHLHTFPSILHGLDKFVELSFLLRWVLVVEGVFLYFYAEL